MSEGEIKQKLSKRTVLYMGWIQLSVTGGSRLPAVSHPRCVASSAGTAPGSPDGSGLWLSPLLLQEIYVEQWEDEAS